jgi:hypothetical protein
MQVATILPLRVRIDLTARLFLTWKQQQRQDQAGRQQQQQLYMVAGTAAALVRVTGGQAVSSCCHLQCSSSRSRCSLGAALAAAKVLRMRRHCSSRPAAALLQRLMQQRRLGPGCSFRLALH